MCGRKATFRYEQLHQQQLLNWGLAERGRFASYRGLLNVPSSWISGWLLRKLGTERSLFVGTGSTSLHALCNAASTESAHFYLSQPLTMTSEVKQMSMSCKSRHRLSLSLCIRGRRCYTTVAGCADMTAAVGSACGIHQGELQSSLGNLKAIVNIVTPLVWGRICESPDSICCGQLIRLTSF